MGYLDVIDDAIGLSLIGDQKSVEQRLLSLDADVLSELQKKLRDALPAPKQASAKFRFVGNSELSGLPFPCASQECRGRGINQSAFFSAAYADETILFNPFHAIVPHTKQDHAEELSFHICQLIMISGLVERGLISFSSFRPHLYCENCFRRGMAAATGGNVEKDFYFGIARDIEEKTKVIYDFRSNNGFHFSIDTKSEFYGHEQGGYVVGSRPKFISRIKPGDTLTQEQISELGLSHRSASFAANDIVSTAAISSNTGASNIFTTRAHKSVLRSYFGSEKIGGDISISYPFLSRGAVSDILKFRDSEWHHLHDYREFVEKCIIEGNDVRVELTNEFVNLRKIVEKADRNINKKLWVDGAVMAANLTAAVATSGVSAIMAGVLGVLGGGHFVGKMVPDLVQKFSESEEVRDSKVYYAWRLSEGRIH